MPKDGHSRKKRTYRCLDGDCRYTPDGNRRRCPEKTIRQALGYLPAERRARGKGSEANRNEGLSAKSRTRLNRLGRAASGCGEKLETLANSLALARLREGLIMNVSARREYRFGKKSEKAPVQRRST